MLLRWIFVDHYWLVVFHNNWIWPSDVRLVGDVPPVRPNIIWLRPDHAGDRAIHPQLDLDSFVRGVRQQWG